MEIEISKKLDKIEEEIIKLKILLATALHMQKKKKKIVSLKSIIKSASNITDEEIEEAKKAPFKFKIE